MWYAWKQVDMLVGFCWENMNEGDNLEDQDIEGPWIVISHFTHIQDCALTMMWCVGHLVESQSSSVFISQTWSYNIIQIGKNAVQIFSDATVSTQVQSGPMCVNSSFHFHVKSCHG